MTPVDPANRSMAARDLVAVDAELGEHYLSAVGASLVSRSAMACTSARLARHAFSRPLFVPEPCARQLGAELKSLLRVVASVPASLGETEWSALGRRLGVPARIARLFEGEPVSYPATYGRADLVFDGSRFRLLELGLTPPVGMPEWAYSIPQDMLRNEGFSQFAQEHRIGVAGDPAAALRDMIEAGASGAVQHVVVADAVGAFAEFGEELLALAREIERVGFTGEVLEVDRLPEPDPTTAWLRMFTLSDFLIDPGMFGEWERIRSRYRTRCDPFVTALASELFNCKGMLAAARSEPVLDAVDARDAEAVRRLLPETWMLAALSDATVLAEQHELILKRSVGAGGDGTTAGWTVGADEWRYVVADARAHGGYVAQRRVDPTPLTTHSAGGAQTWRVVWGVHYGAAGLAGLSARVAPVDELQVGPNRGARPAPGLLVA